MDEPVPDESESTELTATEASGAEHSKQMVARAVFTASSGPVPPPDVLRQYDEIVPGAAERILAQAERQTNHRIQIEKTAIESDVRRSWAGLWCGFAVAMAVIVGGCILIGLDHDVAGATIVTTSLVGLVGVFVYGTSQQRRERQQKASTVPATTEK